MSSSRAEPRSISTQLVLLFTLSAALLLSCSLGILYWVVVRHAFEEDNIVLADKVDALENALQHGGLDALSPEIHETHGSEYAFLVRLLDSSGATIKQTPGMETLLPANVFPPSASREMAAPIEYQKAGHVFALTTRGPVANGQPFTLQVGQNRSSDRRFEKELRTLLALVLGLGVIASALIAVTVARRGLRPLAEMRRSLERVQPGHLSERIEPARWPRELQPLAVSFDAMLGRLEDSFTRLSQFSADLAHELRTPIGNMIGEAQVALTRERNADEYRSVIESTAAECERLSGIIDNLLFLARADSAEQQIQRSQFNGRAALEKITSFYQPLAEERRITITCEGEAEIFADPILFNRAVGNLIDNALRFTPDGGSIRISIRNAENATEISITDTGSGIAPEHLPRVFDRFYRADPSRSSAGTGLGLALVRSIVDLHGGRAMIQSGLGGGTTVTLTFPNQTAAETKQLRLS